ncbi:MAG: class II aldolase/adducin family protein, partial [Pseudomonadota bacterium]
MTGQPTETEIRDQIAVMAKSLFDRGYSCGSSGNISVLVEDGVLVTPTNSCMGRLDPARISKLSHDGAHLSGDKAS